MPLIDSFRLKTIKSKLILYTLSMLIPVIIFSIIYMVQSQRILESKAGQLVSESLALSMSWMDEVLAGAVRLSTTVESDSSLRDFLEVHQHQDLSSIDVLQIRGIEDRLSEMLGTEKRASSIWIYFSSTHEVISSQYGHYQVTDDRGLEWLKSHMTQGQLRTWIYPDEQIVPNGGSLLDVTGLQGNSHVSFVRAIPGLGNERYPVIVGVGYLKFTVQDVFNEVANRTDTSLLLIDRSGHLVDSETPSSGNKFPVTSLMNQLHITDSQKKPYFIFDNWLVTSSDSHLTGWRMVSVAPLDHFMGGIRFLNGLTISLTASAILLALFTARSLTIGFHKPLRMLLAGMKRMEGGDLTVRIHDNRSDEFRRLSDGFNRMVATQDRLIRTVYQERIAKQQAEMDVLTAQINPHFLYNTLGALYAMAKKSDEALAKSLLAMSRLFRLSLNRGREMITVEESVEQITNYIYLLNIRNTGKYCMEAYVEPGAEKFHIPNLLLQPIVENSVRHGLETVHTQGLIRLSVTLLKTDLLLMISDNGQGMDAEMLQKVRDSLENNGLEENKTINGSGYALNNIFRRLTLKYGSNGYIFKIDSEQNKGTTVTIRIPQFTDRKKEDVAI